MHAEKGQINRGLEEDTRNVSLKTNKRQVPLEGSNYENEDFTENEPKADAVPDIVRACHTEINEVKVTKSVKMWLKDPRLYKVGTLIIKLRSGRWLRNY